MENENETIGESLHRRGLALRECGLNTVLVETVLAKIAWTKEFARHYFDCAISSEIALRIIENTSDTSDMRTAANYIRSKLDEQSKRGEDGTLT